ncbi:AbiTii domain-containing protein [Candidatus Nitrosotenuis sp. DW1]|uniref:AbiTii domain-containing protein n=1 Tax=Candidatus Nitrosotenuis sp. DW1 TaxID=2259672 RepID=UPI0015CC3BF5|nr:hypothetical protein [Candidatus Nitrosotenuis sp. DW1]QLH09496.1 hypothetical protein DSQ19_08440 [Candidatus Nitrosotenuis sp. DW1]
MITKGMPRELDEALRIARGVRDAIISGTGKTTSNLRGFLTVAQILAREEDQKWAESELNGYADSNLPQYRSSSFGYVSDDKVRLKMSHNIPIASGVAKMESYSRKGDDNTYVKLAVRPAIKQKVSDILGSMRISNWDEITVDVPRIEFDGIVDNIETEMIKRLNKMVIEITYGNIPYDIFKEFQEKVDKKLADSAPQAVSALNTANEMLGISEDPERVAAVALACRRLIKHVADEVFQARKEPYMFEINGKQIPLDVSDAKTLNRLAAYVDSLKIPSRKQLIAQVDLLRQFYSGDESVINKGIHGDIGNAEARRMVLYTYVLLGDILLAKEQQI